MRSGDGTWTWDNAGATSGTEGQTEGLCYEFSTSSVQSDVWFVWTATVDGTAVLSTCSSTGTNTDTKIAAYAGACCPADDTALACNDDTCGTLSEITFSVACGESYIIQLGSFPGSVDGTADVTATQSGTPCAQVSTAWTQSVNNTVIAAGAGIVCLGEESHAWRLYDPIVQGVLGDFEIADVTFGAERAISTGGMQPITVVVRDGTNFPVVANMPVLATVDLMIPDNVASDQAFYTVLVATGTIPAETPIALELVSFGAGNDFVPGFNELGQTAPNYISTPACGGFPEPTDLAQLPTPFPNQHLILDCTSLEAPPADDAIGCNYCGPAVPNSAGLSAKIAANGSTVISDNDLTLTATDLPPGQFGYFLAGQAQGLANPPGSQGNICLVGNTGRYDDPPQIIQGPTGSLQADLNAVPVNPPTAVLPGDTWNFQCWYRDNNPTATSNFTDAVSVTFQ
ncbi:MAG: hypothetical protein GY711_24230 [bacterium]|nr:hypothetical protein [bacterium]